MKAERVNPVGARSESQRPAAASHAVAHARLLDQAERIERADNARHARKAHVRHAGDIGARQRLAKLQRGQHALDVILPDKRLTDAKFLVHCFSPHFFLSLEHI